MTDWEKAQEIVAQKVDGKVTPGSGNGNKKGDVVKPGWMFEVKQTSKETLALKKTWLRKLQKEAKNNQSALVIFFELRGYVFYGEDVPHKENINWKSLSFKEDKIPKVLYTEGRQWHLLEWSQLQDLM